MNPFWVTAIWDRNDTLVAFPELLQKQVFDDDVFPCHSSMDRSKGNGLGTGGHLNVNFAVNVKEDGQNLGFGPFGG